MLQDGSDSQESLRGQKNSSAAQRTFVVQSASSTPQDVFAAPNVDGNLGCPIITEQVIDCLVAGFMAPVRQNQRQLEKFSEETVSIRGQETAPASSVVVPGIVSSRATKPPMVPQVAAKLPLFSSTTSAATGVHGQVGDLLGLDPRELSSSAVPSTNSTKQESSAIDDLFSLSPLQGRSTQSAPVDYLASIPVPTYNPSGTVSSDFLVPSRSQAATPAARRSIGAPPVGIDFRNLSSSASNPGLMGASHQASTASSTLFSAAVPAPESPVQKYFSKIVEPAVKSYTGNPHLSLLHGRQGKEQAVSFQTDCARCKGDDTRILDLIYQYLVNGPGNKSKNSFKYFLAKQAAEEVDSSWLQGKSPGEDSIDSVVNGLAKIVLQARYGATPSK